MTPFGRRVVAIMGFTIGVCSAHLSAAPQTRVEVAGSAGFLSGNDISGTQLITVGAASRIYWNDRWSFAPEFEHLRGIWGLASPAVPRFAAFSSIPLSPSTSTRRTVSGPTWWVARA